MKVKKHSITHALSGTIAVLLSTFVALPAAYSQNATLPAASKVPVVAKVNQTFGVTLEGKERQDFNFDLPKGEFFIYVDGQIINDYPRIFGELELLKRNGAPLPAYSGTFKFWYGNERIWRDGKKFRLAAPTGIRFRLKNVGTETNNYWIKVVPVTAKSQFVPFGFKTPVTAAKIGPNNGAGGTIEPSQIVFQRAMIPAGKWSVSLGIQGDEGRALATLNFLDANGMNTNYGSFDSAASDYGGEARAEKIITLAKPTTFILRVWNQASSITSKYDVTIEPAT